MAYDEFIADRIRKLLSERNLTHVEKKMMGGLVFMVREKMVLGIHIDKKFGDTLMMAKIGIEAYADEIKKEECLPMDFTGRPMKGFIFVTPDGFDTEEQLEYWVNLALDYNRNLTSKT
jgi:hypothetical protein